MSIASIFGTGIFLHHAGFQMETFPIGFLISEIGCMWLLLVVTFVFFIWNLVTGARSSKLMATALFILVSVTCPRFDYISREQRTYLKGVAERLQRDVDPTQLQVWAAGLMPDAPPRQGQPLRLLNGKVVDMGDNSDGRLFIPLPSIHPPPVTAT